jgi:ATP-dependent exoDNAse (exonuclease V) alpha subunit
MNIELTNKQIEVLQLLEDFVSGKYKNPEHPKVLIIDGFAGTGKSTTISVFLDLMKKRGRDYAVLTYTGKASQVLQEKGLNTARTIHSFLYDVIVNKDGTLSYQLKDPFSPYCDFDKDFILVDESSFIDDKIYEELYDNCNKIIYVGDSYQLSLNRSDKLSNIDISLTEPLRFALESEIGKLANDIRVQNRLPYTYRYDANISWAGVNNYDIMICYRNDTRNMLNLNYRRNVLGTTGYVGQGEKIMFLNNSMNDTISDRGKEFKIVNGLIITLEEKPLVIREFGGEGVIFKYKNHLFSFGEKLRFVKLKGGQFFFLKYQDGDSLIVHPVTYAYAITCHKAQGSEWDKVLFIKESNDPHYLYTGVTRAKEILKIVGRVV